MSSSPKYNLLYEAFGWEVPTYVHVPLITDENHKKLSKRSGHSSFGDLLEQGFLSEAIVNYVALLGWSPSDDREILSMEELIRDFDYRRVNKSPAVFDIGKLRWMNGEYIKKMDDAAYLEKAMPYVTAAIPSVADQEAVALMVKSRIETFADIPEMIAFLEEVPAYDISMYTHKKMKTDPALSLKVLKDVQPVLAGTDDYTNDALYELLRGFAAEAGYKNGQVLWPVRTALSGMEMTPGGATQLLEILGKEESLKRIEAAIEKLTQEFHE